MRKRVSGFLIGIINCLFGAGAGTVGVMMMKKDGLGQKNAQATTLAVILPLSFISMLIYLLRGDFRIIDALYYIPFGFAGAVLGVYLMDKIKTDLLKKIFALFMIYTGTRMILR